MTKEIQKQLSFIIKKEIKRLTEKYEERLRILFNIIDNDPDKSRLKNLDKAREARELWELIYEDRVKELEFILRVINNWDSFLINLISTKSRLSEYDSLKKLLKKIKVK